MKKKNNPKKPSVKVQDMASKNDPSGGNIKFKFTTTTKDKVDTYVAPESSLDASLKTAALANKLNTNK